MAIVRRCIWRAKEAEDWHEAVECAVRADGSSPAESFLTALQAGAWDEAPDHRPPHDDEQIHDFYKLLAKIESVGRHGMPDTSTSTNYLEDGIWEFKHHTRRLTYWDTPGDGTYSPKPKFKSDDERPTECPEGGYWWYPDMDAYLRLGVAWPKTDDLAPPEGIQEAIQVRAEDCGHDQS